MKIKIIQTNDKRHWTEHKARNIGVSASSGEYVFLIDVDYILPKKTIVKAMKFTGDRMNIRRRFGILDKTGNLKSDVKTLKKYHVKERWIRKVYFPGHRSQFLIKKSLFWDLGGYNELLDARPKKWTGGAGEKFWRQWQRAERSGLCELDKDTLEVFMFPQERWCTQKPKTIFHDLPTVCVT